MKIKIISLNSYFQDLSLSSTVFILRLTSVRMWHKAFLRLALSQDRSPRASGSSKNATGPVGIPLFRAPQALGDELNPSEEG